MASIDYLLLTAIEYGALALAVWAFVDALLRPSNAYVAASKLTKPAWAGITALAAVFIYVFAAPNILWIAGVVAAAVYLVDVRPAVRGLQQGGNNPW